MKRLLVTLLLVSLPLLAGCAKKAADNNAAVSPAESTATTPATTPATGAAPAPAAETSATAPAASVLLEKSQYDDGPRAAAGPVDDAMAAAGGKLFATRGCVACHAYGKKLTGPDLKGVTTRRTSVWMVNQIMSPEVMMRTDPISHGLMVQNKNLQMLNLHLTQSEALSLVEYFKKLDAAK